MTKKYQEKETYREKGTQPLSSLLILDAGRDALFRISQRAIKIKKTCMWARCAV